MNNNSSDNDPLYDPPQVSDADVSEDPLVSASPNSSPDASSSHSNDHVDSEHDHSDDLDTEDLDEPNWPSSAFFDWDLDSEEQDRARSCFSGLLGFVSGVAATAAFFYFRERNQKAWYEEMYAPYAKKARKVYKKNRKHLPW